MNEYLKGKIATYCYMIERGKPAASLSIQKRYATEAIQMCDDRGMNHLLENLAEGWNTLWIFKHDYISDVILHLPKTPQNSFDHWALGKLYGYDESSIREFITRP